MISVNLKGRFGNHLWLYAVCRTVAEFNGYDFHIPQNWAGTKLFNCSLGAQKDLTNSVYEEHISQKFDSKIFNIKDFTKLDGYFQSEQYVINNKKNIIDWFKFSYNGMFHIKNDTCVIHLRGNDYKNMGDVYLPKKYYYDSINFLSSINKNLKYIIVTDDQNAAAQYFPNFLIMPTDIYTDYYFLNTAKYLIISNSTFSWWAAWLNKNNIITIAPKYWFKHNISDGWWSPANSITTGFLYMDKFGNISNSNMCSNELNLEDKDLNNINNYILVDS